MKKSIIVLGIMFFYSIVTIACDYDFRGGQIVHLPSGSLVDEKSSGLESFACVGSSLAVLRSDYSIDLKFKHQLSVYNNGFLLMRHDLTAVAPNFISDKLYLSALNNQFMIVSKFEFATIQKEVLRLYYDINGQYSEGIIYDAPRKNCAHFHLDPLNLQAFSIITGKTFSAIPERLIHEIQEEFKQSLPPSVEKEKTKINLSFRTVQCTKDNFSAILNIRMTHENVNTFLEKTPLVFLDTSSSNQSLLEYNGEYLQMYLRVDGNILAYQINSPVIHIFSPQGVFLGKLDPTQN